MGEQTMRTICIYLIRTYQRWLSPMLGNRCRFHPTCSHYAISAIERFGAIYGICMATGRIFRCHPWNAGGVDPVPDQFQLRFWRKSPALVEVQPFTHSDSPSCSSTTPSTSDNLP
jgi:putative membrane protein insertion efficiency factor